MRTLTDVRGGLERIAQNEKGSIWPEALGWLGGIAVFVGMSAYIQWSEQDAWLRQNNFPEYHFSGNIGSERVIFEEYRTCNCSSLVVQKPDGRTVKYTLAERPDHTLVLEEVVVSTVSGDGKVREVQFSAKSPNKEIAEVVKTAGQDAGRYLAAVVTEKTRQYNSQAPSAPSIQR